MTITSITRQKANDDRYNVYIDGEFSFSASSEDIFKYSIREGLEINDELLGDIRNECEYSKAYTYALNLLETKNYTSAEIRKKLRNKNYSEKTTEEVLTKLKSYQFVDDNRYTERYINDCLNFKKYGKKKIMYNLKSKGVESDLINNAEFDFEIQYNNAYQLAGKKLKMVANKPNQKEKVFQYLAGRGYEVGLIVKIIRRLFDGTDDFEIDLDE